MFCHIAHLKGSFTRKSLSRIDILRRVTLFLRIRLPVSGFSVAFTLLVQDKSSATASGLDFR